MDITFADPSEVEPVTPKNCMNTTDPDQHLGFNLVFSTTSLNAASSMSATAAKFGLVPLAVALLTALWL